jgi:serine/threonine-protein kinase
VALQCKRCGGRFPLEAEFCGRCGFELVDPNIGRTVALRYVLQAKIGSGSLGVVYRAEQIGLGRKVACKILHAEDRDPRTVERFLREGQLLCHLRSPHTITTYEYGSEPDGSLYIAMEMSPGRTLASLLRNGAPFPWPRALRVLAGLCDSLSEAHQLGIVHRDLKPDNILLEARANERDFVKVTDFGLAKTLAEATQHSPPKETVASIRYVSPEQLLVRPLDARSDIYALGLLGYHMITGVHPFHSARSFGDLVSAHIHAVPAPPTSVTPDLPADLDVLLACCLDKERDRRFADTAALVAMINLLLTGVPHEGDTIRERDPGEEDTLLAPDEP